MHVCGMMSAEQMLIVCVRMCADLKRWRKTDGARGC
jgi:D-serine dehydratase